MISIIDDIISIPLIPFYILLTSIRIFLDFSSSSSFGKISVLILSLMLFKRISFLLSSFYAFSTASSNIFVPAVSSSYAKISLGEADRIPAIFPYYIKNEAV